MSQGRKVIEFQKSDSLDSVHQDCRCKSQYMG